MVEKTDSQHLVNEPRQEAGGGRLAVARPPAQPGSEPPAQPGNEPGLHLVLGPPNSGKLGVALQWWQSHLHEAPLVVAPTGPDAHELTLEMVRRVGALVGASPAVTFAGLVATILGERPHYASQFQKELVVSEVLQRVPLRALGGIVSFPGTPGAIVTLLQQLEESGRPADEIGALLSAWGEADEEAAGLAADLSDVFSLYERARCLYGWASQPAAVRMACTHLQEWRRPVALYGFTSFTRGQRRLVEALSAQVPVVLALSYDRTRVVNLVRSSEVEHWEALAKQTVELSCQTQAYSAPAVAYLERAFAGVVPAEPSPPSDSRQGVRFLLSAGQRNEAELAAQEIVRLLREGVHPGHIGVVVRQVQGWSSLLSQVFSSCGIPYRLDAGKELRHTGLGYAFINVLAGWCQNDAECLLTFLRSPYSGLPCEEAARTESKYRQGRARGAEALVRILGAQAPAALLTAKNATVKTGEANLSAADAACLHPGILRNLAQELLVSGLQNTSALSDPLLSREAEEDVRAFTAINEALASLDEISQKTTNPEPLLTAQILPTMARIMVPPGPVEGQEAVQILSPHRARARRFDALFVLGLVEGEFPASSDSPSLLSEAQRVQLERLGGPEIFPVQTDEEALFASLLSRPWQLLYLSARNSDEGGSEVLPSPLWQRCLEVLRPQGSPDIYRSLAHQVLPLREAPTWRHFRRACVASGLSVAGLEGALPGSVSERSRGSRRKKRAAALRHPAVLSALAARDTFSASELENYLNCPLAWFLNFCVHVEEDEPELDGRVLGSLAHATLCLTYRELASRGLLPLTAGALPEAVAVAFAVIEELVESETCPGPASERRLAAVQLKNMVEGWLCAEAEGGGSLVATQTEVLVGADQGVDIGGLFLKGKIDRVDTVPGKGLLFVIDYKTGDIPALSHLGQKDGLQLPLYLLAIARERPHDQVIGGAYVSLRTQQSSGVVRTGYADVLGEPLQRCQVVDEEAEERLWADTLALASEAAAGIRSGSIAPLSGHKCPLWCGLGPVCRVRRGW